MNPQRKAMNDAFRMSVVPVLRQMGFQGSLPHFRRCLPDRIDLLTIQFKSSGGSFVAEIASSGPNGVIMSWGEEIPPNKVTAQHVSPVQRPRLRPPNAMDDYWFEFTKKKTPEDAVAELLPLLESIAEPWWNAA
jgi:hypothetical protein